MKARAREASPAPAPELRHNAANCTHTFRTASMAPASVLPARAKGSGLAERRRAKASATAGAMGCRLGKPGSATIEEASNTQSAVPPPRCSRGASTSATRAKASASRLSARPRSNARSSNALLCTRSWSDVAPRSMAHATTGARTCAAPVVARAARATAPSSASATR